MRFEQVDEELLRFEVPEFNDDQHAPLSHSKRGSWLRQQCPRELRKISAMALDKSTEHVKVIETVATAETQYALLMWYHKLIGNVTAPVRRASMTLEEEVEAFNMFQRGASIPEIATKLNKNPCTIWRLAPGEPTRKYHHLNRYQKQEIDRLHEMKTPCKEIARLIGMPHRSVRYYLYETEKK